MACLPYDMLNIFDMTSDNAAKPDVTLTTFGGADNVTEILSNYQHAPSGNSYGNIFSILKVRLFLEKVRSTFGLVGIEAF